MAMNVRLPLLLRDHQLEVSHLSQWRLNHIETTLRFAIP